MRKLKINELLLVNGGTITDNGDGTKTTNDARDCTTIYGSGIMSTGLVRSCQMDVIARGAHTTK